MQIWTVWNRKGGIGKTTTVANLGAGLAQRGHRTLVVDADNQCNLSLAFKWAGSTPSLHEILMDDAPLTVWPTGLEMLHLVTGSRELGALESAVDQKVWESFRSDPSRNILDQDPDELRADYLAPRFQRLFEKLAEHQYEYVIFDVPAQDNLFVTLALAFSTRILVPVQCEYFSVEGLKLAKEILNDMEATAPVALLRTMASPQWKHTAEQSKAVEAYGADVLKASIKRGIAVNDGAAYGMPIVVWAPAHEVSRAYNEAIDELLAAPVAQGAAAS